MNTTHRIFRLVKHCIQTSSNIIKHHHAGHGSKLGSWNIRNMTMGTWQWWKMMKMLSWIFLDTLNHSNLWGSLRHCFFDGSVAEFGLFTETVAGHSATSATTRPTRSHGHLPGSACNHRMLESVWINGYQHSLKVTIYIYIYIYNWITSRRPMLGPQAEI